MIQAGPLKKPPQTEVEFLIAAQNDAAAEEKRRQIAAERAKFMAERDAMLKAMPPMPTESITITPAAVQAATMIRDALGTRYAEFMGHVRMTNLAALREEMIKLEGDAQAVVKHAGIVQGAQSRAVKVAAEDQAREARRAAVLEAAGC